MVILWTDALIFLLVAMLLAVGWRLHGREEIRRPWQKVMRSRSGMVSLAVLMFFVAVGLLDSFHFKPAAKKTSEIVSVLDYLADPIRSRHEKTYSAPFAAYLYSKEYMTAADGRQIWDYPRLKYGGAHLSDPETERAGDILSRALSGFSKGAGLFLFFIVLLWSLLKEKKRRLFSSSAAKAAWGAVFLMVSVSYMLIELSLYYHVMGTDKVGEDVFYQTLKSIRTGLVIGTLTTLIMLPLAITLGILAGFFRGWVDDVIQYVYTTLNSIPGVLLIAASILMVQVYMANHEEAYASLELRADMRLLFLCLILGVTNWTGLCRLLRAETLKLREMEYVLAARALGVRQGKILMRHILPNVMHIVLISVVLDFSGLVLAEAVLSYINIGVDPTTYSWGNMINGARLEMAREPIVWWSLAAAFVFMFTLVLAA
ncbi:MAG: ABC transporter permease, partial [Gammaproteobacteria bacterium]